MTVKELRAALDALPDFALIAWCDDKATVGYFYADEQELAVDDGHVHLQLGAAPEACDHGKREGEECSACEYDRMSDGESDRARL